MKKRKELEYKSIFGSLTVKPIVSAEKDKYLSLASIDQLKKFLPDVDSEKNYDLLPISFSACVVNRVNKNKDVILTSTALNIYDTFINKPINLDHNQKKVVGCIVSAGFSEFGTEKPLTLEQVKDMTSPFNITLGGVIWRNVSDELADLIEDCADPESQNYLKVSASWELGYKDFSILAIEGDSKNSEDGRVINDKEEVTKIKANLTAFGGKGKIGEENLYRCPTEGVLAIGIGLTESPAADVQGVACEEETKEEEIDTENASLQVAASENISNNISQVKITNVKENKINMKITSLKDINAESIKVIEASAITDFVSEEIKKANDEFLKEKEAKENLLKAHKEEVNTLNETLAKANKEIETLKAEVDKIQKAIEEKKSEEIFSARMSEFDADYNLDDEDRSALASEIKNLKTDESYAAFKKNAQTFLKNKKKMPKGQKPMDKKGDEACASTVVASEQKAQEEQVVADAVASAKVQTPSVPATPSKEDSQKDRWAKAFAPENVLIKKR